MRMLISGEDCSREGLVRLKEIVSVSPGARVVERAEDRTRDPVVWFHAMSVGHGCTRQAAVQLVRHLV